MPDDVEPARSARRRCVREGRDVTIIAYGGHDATSPWRPPGTLAEEGIEAEVVDLRTLRPWDKETVTGSVRKTHRAVVVEEPPPVCGIGAEVAANIYEQCFDTLRRADRARVRGGRAAAVRGRAGAGLHPARGGRGAAARKALGR